MMLRKNVVIRMDTEYYSPEIKVINIAYSFEDTKLYETKIKVSIDDRKSFSRIDLLKTEKLEQIIKTINRDIENIVKPQLIYIH